MKGEEVTSNDNKINELNTVRLDNFSPQYDECLIEGLFSKYGEIKKVWFNVETERGFGFVEFEQRRSAFMAISEENGKNYDGHDIIVEHFDDNINRFLPTSVFISKENLTADQVVYKFDDLNSKSEKEADLRSLFTRFGKIINVHIYKLGEEERNGFVVVEFADVVSAVNAKVKMSSFKMPSGELMKINLCTADEIEEKRKAFECENTDENWNTVCLSSNMADLNVDEQIECSNSISAVSEKTVKTDEFIVYVYGFESDIQNEEELKSLFEKFGEVKWVKIFNQDENTKADDAIRSIYGCVSYDNEADAKVRSKK
ncbi:polyadenylate-binding protein 7-like protein [Leptotrombidium deliense]|uniref:Polyadenylate-binding protein 7-like protein n=1 Tax=Leptotrombidium deliense TaxID=299467 RepID=A0A443S226_9ACAR|nr:polyadenylate-binding protein 7-like protein [Leptotrombidium deliense]